MDKAADIAISKNYTATDLYRDNAFNEAVKTREKKHNGKRDGSIQISGIDAKINEKKGKKEKAANKEKTS
jgi:hypothetical protein